jgi:hypothetical protein
MALARQAVLRTLSTFRRGDQICLIPVGGIGSSIATFTGDLQSVAARVSDLKPCAGTANFELALHQAADLLERQEGSDKQIYIYCDTQAASWASIDEDVAASLRQRLAATRVLALRVGSEDVENLQIESVEVLNPPVVAGSETQVEVRVRNHGKSARLGVPLAVRAGGRDIAATTINVAPGETSRLLATFAGGNQPGFLTLSAELRGGDWNEPDDRLDKVVETVRPIRTLIVRDGFREPDYLSLALRGVASADVIDSDDWNAQMLADYQVIIFDDAPAPTATQSRALEQFVYAGGGLLIAPGATARIDDYNRLLYREEAGLLPALLQPPVAPPAQRIEPTTFDASHPLMSFVNGGSPASVSVQRYLPITARTASARVLGAYTSGDPFIIESAFGAGRVVLITCGLDAGWSKLPLTNAYLPLVQSTVRRLARSSDAQNVTAGQAIVLAMRPPIEANRAMVQAPDGAQISVDVQQLEDHSEIRFAGTELSGVYTVRAGPRGKERAMPFAVLPAAGESDLTPIDAVNWATLSDELGFAREQSAGSRSWWATLRETSGFGWLAALIGVLILLVAEMWMTRRWSSPAQARAIAGAAS